MVETGFDIYFMFKFVDLNAIKQAIKLYNGHKHEHTTNMIRVCAPGKFWNRIYMYCISLSRIRTNNVGFAPKDDFDPPGRRQGLMES